MHRLEVSSIGFGSYRIRGKVYPHAGSAAFTVTVEDRVLGDTALGLVEVWFESRSETPTGWGSVLSVEFVPAEHMALALTDAVDGTVLAALLDHAVAFWRDGVRAAAEGGSRFVGGVLRV